MPDFRGENIYIIQPNDSNVPFGFRFTPASAPFVNDGNIPYNTSVASVAVTAHKDDGTDVSSTMIGTPAPSVLDNIVAVRINWPGAVGRYHLVIVATLDDGSKKEFDFNRYVARDQ
ncbi:MAG: hypothetical protein PVI03_03570 [Candidatus Thorarchaeota archaeon]|jgi:hypothetical protein